MLLAFRVMRFAINFTIFTFTSSIVSAFSPSLKPEYPCPLLGPDFLAPKDLLSFPVIRNALDNLTNLLNTSVTSGTTPNGPVQLNTTSFSISIFSTSDCPRSNHLFQCHRSSPTLAKAISGVRTVDANSIYRIGSISKLFTVYTFLVESGYAHWLDPVTQWVPELAVAADAMQEPNQEAAILAQWHDITLGDLASQLSGLGRDYGVFDLATILPKAESLMAGLPPLNSTDVPPCGLRPTCSRAAFFAGYTKRHPVFLSTTTPSYSNAAFQILSYALEAITGKPFEDSLKNRIFIPLEMHSSSLSEPINSSAGVIPVNDTASGWALSGGDEAPAGAMYMSLDDLTAAGISMLKSTLLPSATTRRWFQPASHTSNLLNAVGAPWEIYRDVAAASGRVVDWYTKSGDVGVYASFLALSQDYQVGFGILAAQDSGSPTVSVSVLADLIGDTLLPALEVAAHQQAASAFVGTYYSSPQNSITLADDSLPGIAIINWTMNGTNEMAVLAKLLQKPNVALRLYPTNLISSSSTGTTRVYRLVPASPPNDTGTFSLDCQTWADVDNPVYGSQAVDEFIFMFGMDDTVKSVMLPAFRQTLVKSIST